MSKIKAIRVVFTFSESPNIKKGLSFLSLSGANEFIDRQNLLAKTDLPHGHKDCYWKTDFTIFFADGETYKGRYDIGCSGNQPGGLSGHIMGLVHFYSGKACPSHMKEKDYKDFLADPFTIKTAKEYSEFAAKYELETAQSGALKKEIKEDTKKIEREIFIGYALSNGPWPAYLRN